MTETAKHTPTPWVKNRYGRLEGANGKAVTVDDLGIAMALNGSDEEERANAEFIVRACNAHADLVEALAHAHKELMWAYEQDEYAHGAAGLRLAAQECWAALAKARGDQS